MHLKSSPVKSWPIHLNPLDRRSDAADRVATTTTPSLDLSGNPTPRGVLTTGLFDVPSGEGNIIELQFFISSFSNRPETAQIQLFERQGDELVPAFSRRVSVPAGGVRHITIEDVENKTIAIDVRLSSPRLHPSAAVTQTFLADGAVIVLVYKTPADFIPV